MWNGLLTHASSKSQESAGMLTFRDHVALKLRASHVFSAQLLNVILRGMSAPLRRLDFCSQHGSKAHSFLPYNPGVPNYAHCLDFCWQT